jgi:hypothetical protein
VITMIKDNAKMRTAALPGVLADPVLNRGVAFSAADREALGLTGRLPAAVLTLEEQAERATSRRRLPPLSWGPATSI